MCVLSFLDRLAAEYVFIQVFTRILMLEGHAGSTSLSTQLPQAPDAGSLRIVPAGRFAGALVAVQNFGQGVSNIFHKPIEVCTSANLDEKPCCRVILGKIDDFVHPLTNTR